MIEEYLIWCLRPKAFSGSIVESLHDEFDFLLSDRGEAAFLRKYWRMEKKLKDSGKVGDIEAIFLSGRK